MERFNTAVRVTVLLIALVWLSGLASLPGTAPAPGLAAPLWAEAADISQARPGEAGSSLLLPDMYTLPPFDLRLVIQNGGERRRLRFSNSVWNLGPGPLEVRGRNFQPGRSVEIYQALFRADGTFERHELGEFVFHGPHGHWHWTGFSLYEVWTVEPDGTLGRVATSSGKVGYCLRDDTRMLSDGLGRQVLDESAARPRPVYGGCAWQRQGISAGWQDTYDHDTEGQFVDVSRLRDGVYALRSTADPDDQVREGDEDNNAAMVFFGLYGERLVTFGIAPPFNSGEDVYPLLRQWRGVMIE